MSDSTSDIGEGLVVGFKNLHEFAKSSGVNLSVFSSAGIKRKGDKSADDDNEYQYGTRRDIYRSAHKVSFPRSYPFATEGSQ